MWAVLAGCPSISCELDLDLMSDKATIAQRRDLMHAASLLEDSGAEVWWVARVAIRTSGIRFLIEALSRRGQPARIHVGYMPGAAEVLDVFDFASDPGAATRAVASVISILRDFDRTPD